MPSAPEKLPEVDRKGFHFELPSHETGLAIHWQSWGEWAELHKALGQLLAERIRRRD